MNFSGDASALIKFVDIIIHPDFEPTPQHTRAATFCELFPSVDGPIKTSIRAPALMKH